MPLHRLPQHRQGRGGLREHDGRRRRRRRGRLPGDERWRHDRRRRPPHRRDRGRAQAQGGPAPDHRPHQLDRQHPAARDAAPRHGAQPVRPRQHHRHRHHRRRRPPPASSAVFTGRTSPRARAWWRTPGRSTTSRRRPPTCPSPSTTWRAPARSSRSSPRAVPRAARDAAELVDVDYDELPAVLDAREALKDEVLAHPDLGTNKSAFWQLDSAAAGTGGDVEAAIAEGPRERHPHRARVPPAAARPGLHGAAVDGRRPDRRADRHLDGDPDPAHPALPHRRDHRHPGVEGPRHRPRRRRRVRRQAADHSRGVRDPRRRPASSASPASTPRRARRRWSPATTAATSGRRSRSPPPRTARSPASRSSCSPTSAPTWRSSAAACRCSARGCSTPSTSSRPTSSTARRCSPTRPGSTPTAGAGRPEATFAIERLMDELAAEVGVDPLAIREKNWITHEEFPFTSVSGMTYDSGNYEAATARATELFGYEGLRAEQRRRRESQRPGAARHRRLDLHRDVRPGSLAHPRRPQLRRRRLGARHASGCSPPARSRCHRAPRHTGRATRPPGARSSPTAWVCLRGHRGAARRHPDRAQGHGHLRLAVARHRWRGAGQGGRQGHREGQADRGAPARGRRRRRRVLGRAVQRQGHRQGRHDRRGGARRPGPATTCPTASSRASTPTRRSTPTRSPSRTAPTCARWRSTPRPGPRRCASTSASTTSARSSTRSSSRARCTAASSRASRRRCGRVPSTTSNGTLVTGSFVDYTLPTAADTISFVTDNTAPPVDDEHARAPRGSVRPACIASTPAVVNAIVDAVRHLGVNDVLMPCTPERVWKAIQSAGAHSAATRPVRRSRTSRTNPSTRTPRRARRTERHSDPRGLRLPGARPPSTRPSRRSPRAATTPR